MADNQRPKQGDIAGARDHGALVLAQRKDSAADLAGADGQYGPLQMDADGALRTSGTVTVTLPNEGQQTMANSISVAVASDQSAVPVSAASLPLPTGASTLAEQQSQTTALQIMDDWDNGASNGASVSGDVAHDTTDAGEPVKVGAVAIAHGTNPTAVAAADRTNLYANRAGVPFVIGGHPNIVTLEAAYTGAQTDAAIVTISTGAKIVVTMIAVTADNANTVDVGFRVGFGTANTPTTTGVVCTHPGLAAGSGLVIGNGSGMIGVGADNADLRITSEVPTGGSIRVQVSYYTIES